MRGEFYQQLTNDLETARAEGLFKEERIITSAQQADITVADGSHVINFCANNYLGLANHPYLIAAAKAGMDSHGFGMASVRFICGTQDSHKELEQKLAAFLGMEDAILYSSCFDANGGLFETLLPPLKGFQFNRTVFFNPFLWYVALFLALKALYDTGKLFWKRIANLAACIAVAVILLTPAVYNEFYWTCYHQAYRAVKHTEVNLLNFREYYSTDLMEEIKADINYDGEYAAGYGLNTAVLEYSGISTLDGYLGFYPQSYKEEFTKLIWPAYERVPQWQTYYGEWGARAYLFAGSGESIYNPYRNQVLSDHHLYLDSEQFVKMGGKYLFSRYELDNAEELGFTLRGIYSNESAPYTIYLYEI